ncbi:hypothetical protein AMECASPLE_030444 [Ameca splendens]|uniref:Uncharacterized protein n=1 Tax=Ameca splendens TaxID=208324 RepID=A0ABV0YU98_9TELE
MAVLKIWPGSRHPQRGQAGQGQTTQLTFHSLTVEQTDGYEIGLSLIRTKPTVPVKVPLDALLHFGMLSGCFYLSYLSLITFIVHGGKLNMDPHPAMWLGIKRNLALSQSVTQPHTIGCSYIFIVRLAYDALKDDL